MQATRRRPPSVSGWQPHRPACPASASAVRIRGAASAKRGMVDEGGGPWRRTRACELGMPFLSGNAQIRHVLRCRSARRVDGGSSVVAERDVVERN